MNKNSQIEKKELYRNHELVLYKVNIIVGFNTNPTERPEVVGSCWITESAKKGEIIKTEYKEPQWFIRHKKLNQLV